MYAIGIELQSFSLVHGNMERRAIIKVHNRRSDVSMLSMIIEISWIRVTTYYLVPSLMMRFYLAKFNFSVYG